MGVQYVRFGKEMRKETMDDVVNILLRGGQFKELLKQEVQPLLKKYAISMVEAEVLLYMDKNKNDDELNTAKGVVQFLHMNKGHISTTLESLCRKGYLEQRQDKKDRRYVHYEVTEQTVQMETEIRAVWDRLNGIMFEGFTKDELEILRRMAEQMIDNMAKALK